MLFCRVWAASFHATEQSIGTVKAQGENYLDPIKLQYNVGYQTLNHAGNSSPWYVLDIPEDGDLKITILGDGVHIEKLYAGAENIDTFNWVEAYKNVYTNQPYVAHFTTAAGSYEAYLLNSDLRELWRTPYAARNELQTDTEYLTAGTYYFKIRGWSRSKYK